jgi:hypothetical protein
MKQAILLLLLAIAPAVQAAEDKVNFAAQIKPVFLEHCTKCHGERVAKGELRLHTAAAIQEFGADYLLSPAAPEESAILTRITLPADDEMMMPQGGPPLPAETIELIRRWISEGAEMNDDAEPDRETPEEQLPDVSPADPEAIKRLEAAGAQVMPLFHGSPLLRVTFAYTDEKAGDDKVALLTNVAQQIVWLDLSRSAVTDAGTAPLATLENLAHLHLEQTGIGDAALAHLEGLANLEYLNLYATQVTDEGLKHLGGLKKLKRLYLWQAPVSYDAAMALAEATEGLEVNLGWNHPEVARRRLGDELARVKAQKEDAAQRLEQAKREQEAASTREAEIQKELAAIESKPTEETPAEEASTKETSTEETTAEEAAAQEAPEEEAPAKAADQEQAKG